MMARVNKISTISLSLKEKDYENHQEAEVDFSYVSPSYRVPRDPSVRDDNAIVIYTLLCTFPTPSHGYLFICYLDRQHLCSVNSVYEQNFCSV